MPAKFISRELVIAIYTSGDSNASCARRTGIARGTVANIRSDASWYAAITAGLLIDVPEPRGGLSPACSSCDGTGYRDSSEGFVPCPRCRGPRSARRRGKPSLTP